MSWPNDNLTTQHTDSANDSPALAREVINNAIIALKEIIAARDNADGICGLGSNGKVSDSQIGRGEVDGVCDLDSEGKINLARFNIGRGLIFDVNKILHVQAGAKNNNKSLSGVDEKGFISSLDVDEAGLVIGGTVASIPQPSQAFTGWYNTQTQARNAVPNSATFVGIFSRIVQQGTKKDCKYVQKPVIGGLQYECTDVPNFITQYRASYLTT